MKKEACQIGGLYGIQENTPGGSNVFFHGYAVMEERFLELIVIAGNMVKETW